MVDQTRCRATRKDGTPCVQPAKFDGYCWAHAPKYQQARQEGRRRGGQGKATHRRLEKLMPPRLVDVYGRLESALTEVHDGSLTPQRANALANLARAMVATLQVSQMEDRMRVVEEAIQRVMEAKQVR